MTQNEVNERQISSNEWTLHNHLPTTDNILTVVYSDFKNIFMFDSTGLNEEQKEDLVKSLICIIQSGANFSREIVKKVDNIYFVY